MDSGNGGYGAEASGQRLGVDKRVSMLASVINRATGLKPGTISTIQYVLDY